MKNMEITHSSQLPEHIKVWGDPETWQLICKVTDTKGGWMKSTKAMEVKGVGVVIQTTTQQENFIKYSNGASAPTGHYAIADTTVFVPNVSIESVKDDSGIVVSRKIVPRS